MAALARTNINCIIHTRLLVREGAPRKKPKLPESNKNLLIGPRWVPDTQTEWTTGHRSEYDFDLDRLDLSVRLSHHE
jgi:hypothetical protein